MLSIVTLLGEAARLREVEDALHEELDRARQERDEAWAATGLGYRAKQRLVRAADHSAAARTALDVYRRVRGRSSRSV